MSRGIISLERITSQMTQNIKIKERISLFCLFISFTTFAP